ncbi:hypothetical protein C4K25_4538 [Pseudomonas chlororaphis]|nr:hypothetical protein C4K25_4538 [Pseudomonas chlororaphis]
MAATAGPDRSQPAAAATDAITGKSDRRLLAPTEKGAAS